MIRKIYLLSFVFITFFSFKTIAQCNRYVDEVFTEVSITTSIIYGNNINYNTQIQNLSFDFYSATNDTILDQRPVIVMLHGGQFIGGDKSDSLIVSMANKFAKRGFVVANIDYRIAGNSLLSVLEEENFFSATIRAMHDTKASIRFLKENASDYNIDPNMIFVGGHEVGGLVSQMAAQLNNSSELNTQQQNWLSSLGGLEGNTNSISQSSTVAGVINLSGATFDTNIISLNDVPMVSIHASGDEIMPYDYDNIFTYTENSLPCNGFPELCYRRYNEVTEILTHNGHAYREGPYNNLSGNHQKGITDQMNFGIHALGIKVYNASIPCDGNTDSYLDGYDGQLSVYHGSAIFGCENFDHICHQILNFLDNNPQEILTLTIEGDASKEAVFTEMQAFGLSNYMYTHNFSQPWPTLANLINSNKRLIVFKQSVGGAGSNYNGIHDLFNNTKQNNYSTNNPNTIPCAFHRGNASSNLFQMNNFVTSTTSPAGDPSFANTTHDFDILYPKAKNCADLHNLDRPKWIMNNFFQTGDLLEVRDSLNLIGLDFMNVYGSNLVHNRLNNLGIANDFLSFPGSHAPYQNDTVILENSIEFISNFIANNFFDSLCNPLSTGQESGVLSDGNILANVNILDFGSVDINFSSTIIPPAFGRFEYIWSFGSTMEVPPTQNYQAGNHTVGLTTEHYNLYINGASIDASNFACDDQCGIGNGNPDLFFGIHKQIDDAVIGLAIEVPNSSTPSWPQSGPTGIFDPGNQAMLLPVNDIRIKVYESTDDRIDDMAEYNTKIISGSANIITDCGGSVCFNSFYRDLGQYNISVNGVGSFTINPSGGIQSATITCGEQINTTNNYSLSFQIDTFSIVERDTAIFLQSLDSIVGYDTVVVYSNDTIYDTLAIDYFVRTITNNSHTTISQEVVTTTTIFEEELAEINRVTQVWYNTDTITAYHIPILQRDTILYTNNTTTQTNNLFLINNVEKTQKDTFDFRVSALSHLEDNSDWFGIFPNPTNGNFSIIYCTKFIDEKIEIKVFDLLGKVVFSDELFVKKTLETNFDIDIAKGNYLVVIFNNKMVSQKTLVIK